MCHSDVHVIDGDIQILPRMPLVLGHDNASVVAAVGAGVRDVKEGEPVAIFGGWGESLAERLAQRASSSTTSTVAAGIVGV